MRIGFVRLLDAAPLIVAEAKGFFEAQGLEVSLERQIGWMNIRDKLGFGSLDACHSLLGMPIMSQLGRAGFARPMVSVMALGSGGNTIVISQRLAEIGIDSAAALGRLIHGGIYRRKLVCAHVATFSMHHYLLREWLSDGDINPDCDVELTQLTPMQVAEHMANRYVDVFCAGEPWGLLAQQQGWGRVICATTDVVPSHPEKVLAVTESFMRTHRGDALKAIRAILKSCQYCANPANRDELAEILGQDTYLDEHPELIRLSLQATRATMGFGQTLACRPADWTFRNWDVQYCAPSGTHVIWFLKQMQRWGELSGETDLKGIADRCIRHDIYNRAAASLHIDVPKSNYPPMPLRRGVLAPTEVHSAPQAPKQPKIHHQSGSVPGAFACHGH